MQNSAEDIAEGGVSLFGKRGMHSASGAYWNSEKDGMWNFKYEKSESKGFDGGSLLKQTFLYVLSLNHHNQTGLLTRLHPQW